MLGLDSVVLTPPPPADGVCPTDDWLAWGSHCYYFGSDELQLGWDDAVDECRRLAGREYVDTCSLASIHRLFGEELRSDMLSSVKVFLQTNQSGKHFFYSHQSTLTKVHSANERIYFCNCTINSSSN